MAGANLVLKKGQRLFAEGEASDGMYLIRKGEIQVYLEKSGSEVKLASLGSGSMIGEMSLFDKKPRSASARATAETEVTKISNDDFSKLMKQIPKWFVGLMSALSTRLRETNERLQSIEAKHKAHANPLASILRVMILMKLIWHKDATKDGKDWVLEREQCEKPIVDILGLPAEEVAKISAALAEGKMWSIKKNNYKKDILTMANRGSLEKFIEFVEEFLKQYPDQPGVPSEAVQLLECLNHITQESAYDTVTVPMSQIVEEGERRTLPAVAFKDQLPFFKHGGRVLALTKTSDGQIAFKVDKKNLPRLVETYATLAALRNSGVT